MEDAGGRVGKKFNYFYICICIRILIQICIWIRGRWRMGDNGRAQVREGWRRCQGGSMTMVQDDRGWSEGVRTVEDGVKTYHIWIRILIQIGFWIPGRGRTDE